MSRLELGLLASFMMTTCCAHAALPSTFSVVTYTLTLNIPSNTTVGSTVTGNVNINLEATTTTSDLTFHWGSSLLPSTPTSDNITVSDSKGLVQVILSQNSTAETVTLTRTAPATFEAGSSVVINIDYQTTVREEMKGLFFRNFSNDDGTNSSFIATNSWPTNARNILPCLDEPQYSATWDLTLVVPASWGVAASFNLTSNTTDTTSSLTTVKFATTIPLPPSALSIFLTSNMTNSNYSRGQYSTTLSFWSSKVVTDTAITNNNTFLADIYYQVDDLIETNSSLTGGVVHVVKIPNLEEPFSGLGIVYIREDSYYGSYSSAQTEGLFRTKIVPVLREFVRQYAGYTTWPQTWSDAWIPEAIGGYLEYVLLTNMGLPFDFTTDVEVIARQSALSLDTSGSRPLQDTAVNVDSSSAVEASIRDPLKRQKGTVLLNMLDLSFPAGEILTAIKTLLKNNKGETTNSMAFFSLINNTILSSGAFLSSEAENALESIPLWFNASGYPLLNVTDQSAGTPGSISFIMSSFCGSSSCSESPPGWYVSTTVGSRTEPRYLVPRQNIWVTNSTTTTMTTLDISSGDWVAANMKAAGYYRATYNSTNWERVVAAVASGLDEPPGRSQLIDDAFAFSASGLLDYNTSISLVSAMVNSQEPMFSNWYPVYAALWDIRDKLWATDQYSAFQTFTTAVLKNVNAMLLRGTHSNSYQGSRIYAQFLDGMCEMDVTNYRAYAVANLTSLLQGVLPATVFSAAYDAMACCGAQYNTSLTATSLWNSINNFTSSYYSKHYNAVALGCLANYTNVSSIFPMMLNSNAQLNSYVATTFMYLAEKHPINLTSDLPSIVDSLQTKVGAVTVASIIMKAGKKLNNTQAESLNTALNADPVDDVIKVAVVKTLSAATLKSAWLKSYKTTVATALKDNPVSTAAISGATSTHATFVVLAIHAFIVVLVLRF